MSTTLHDLLSALAEPLRLRILYVLEQQELAVGELARVLQTSQPTISRHLKLLDGGGWLVRRRLGTATGYRLDAERLGVDAADLWALLRVRLCAEAAEPTSMVAEDLRRLEVVLSQRTSDSEELFRRLGGRWDDVRRELFGEAYLVPAMLALLPPGRVIVDLGCGTGAMLPLLHPCAREVIGIDREEAMLEVARQRIDGLAGARVERGFLDRLPLPPASVDLALCVLVLHHIREIGPVFKEIGRVLAPGGRAVLVDMVEHSREELRETMGHQHQGFSEAGIAHEAADNGLALVAFHVLPPDPRAQGPGLWVGALEPA